MAFTQVEKLNIPDTSDWLYVPTSFLTQRLGGRKLSPATVMMESLFYSYSNKNKEFAFNGSYAQIRERLNLSNGTVGAAIKRLTNANIVNKQKRGNLCSCYTHNMEDRDVPGIEVPDYLLNIPVTIREHKVNGRIIPSVTRSLKKKEICLISLIMQIKRHEKHNFMKSVRKWAQQMNISPSTAQNYINDLIHADILLRPTKGQGHKRRYLSEYAVNEKLLRTVRKEHERRKKKGKKTSATQFNDYLARIEDANARAERERWYSIRKAEAEARAERYMSLAMADVQFMDANQRMRSFEAKIEIARGRGQDIKELERQLFEAKLQRAERLKVLHISAQDLQPKYHCSKCSDTGYLPNGKQCDCYKST